MTPARAQTRSTVAAWNNLGMHCMDDDYSVFSILPPYNTFHAQVVVGTNGTARLVSPSSSLSVRYRGAVDADGSLNTTSVGKTGFWDYVLPMLGLALAPNEGVPLPGSTPAATMPGSGNPEHPMAPEPGNAWYAGWGIPITPYDDDLRKNPYPMMHLTASGGGVPATTTDIVLPVSDEMDCRLCHSSGSGPDALPSEGWTWDPHPSRDYRKNILRLHDERRFAAIPGDYATILTNRGFSAAGLYTSAVEQGHPVLCAACHLSEAIPNTGYPGVPPLTEAVHGLHAGVTDPLSGQALGGSDNRAACYRCHPGAETKCLRGAMGRAVATDGSLAMQCQNCHGGMADVAATNRTGWLNEPNCQACHTGDAVLNNGAIRYTDVSVPGGQMRVAVNNRFATTPNTPATGLSLYRFSRGHGGLYCSACHGSTHAVFPTSFASDNVASVQHQGHEGTLAECTACHGALPNTVTGGPHGLHPIGNWVDGHRTPGKTEANCAPCHGTGYRGTVLSRTHADRTLSAFGTKRWWRGSQVGCYSCHLGPNNTDVNPNGAPTVQGVSASTTVNTPVGIPLVATDPNANPLTLRVVSQARHGRVGLSGTTATYTPDPGFRGSDTFTFAAWDGSIGSNLATGTVAVSGGPCDALLTPAWASFDARSHIGTVHVDAGAACTWSVASDALWLPLLAPHAPVTGPGDVLYCVEPQTGTTVRTGWLDIAGRPFMVVQNPPSPDGNADGLPDAWQMAYFMSAVSPDAAPGFDFDGDGATNAEEYQAGTDPTDPADVLRITAIAAGAGQPTDVAFDTHADHYYQVHRTERLPSPVWRAFTNAVPGNGASRIVSDGRHDGTAMYYRVWLVK